MVVFDLLSMTTGFFIGNSPYIQVNIGKKSVASPFFVLDTGFSGSLQVNPRLASDIGLSVDGIMNATIADGSSIEIPYGFAFVAMDGSIEEMEILVTGGSQLAGISFLKKFGYTVIVDCRHETVELENSPNF